MQKPNWRKARKQVLVWSLRPSEVGHEISPGAFVRRRRARYHRRKYLVRWSDVLARQQNIQIRFEVQPKPHTVWVLQTERLRRPPAGRGLRIRRRQYAPNPDTHLML
eukprot:1522793-Rhodomonas_salina.1